MGATRFSENKVGAESAAQTLSSGGGFSWYFEQPFYQTNAVTRYFNAQKSIPAAHFYNPYGRGYPDVSTLGVGNFIRFSSVLMISKGIKLLLEELKSLWMEEEQVLSLLLLLSVF